MITIGVLNSKGGTGKTTLTACLAVRAAKDGNAAVLDVDPQSSYSDWYRRRGSPDNPALLTGADRASDAIEALELTSPYDFVFVDGPPGALLVTKDAIETVDFVLIPIRASSLDLTATQSAILLCQDAGTPFMVVINATNNVKLVEAARSSLFNWKVPFAATKIKQRVSYTNAMTIGKTGSEMNKAAAEEIDALWAEVKKTATKAAATHRTKEPAA